MTSSQCLLCHHLDSRCTKHVNRPMSVYIFLWHLNGRYILYWTCNQTDECTCFSVAPHGTSMANICCTKHVNRLMSVGVFFSVVPGQQIHLINRLISVCFFFFFCGISTADTFNRLMTVCVFLWHHDGRYTTCVNRLISVLYVFLWQPKLLTKASGWAP